jgi:hypothetical protein
MSRETDPMPIFLQRQTERHEWLDVASRAYDLDDDVHPGRRNPHDSKRGWRKWWWLAILRSNLFA